MKRLGMCLFLATTVALSLPLVGQQEPAIEHAPTVEQCRADGSLWFSELKDYISASERIEKAQDSLWTPQGTRIGRLTYDQLFARLAEMSDCGSVDRRNVSLYLEVGDGTENVMNNRLHDFILRHNLWERFKTNDEAGKGR